MRTAGLDLAATPQRTAGCVVDWATGAAVVNTLVMGVDDDAAMGLIGAADKCGVDAPFGWPEPFIQALARHHEGHGWPHRDAPQYRRSLKFRLTDEAVRAHVNRDPLSVSADKIAVTAMRCAWLLDRLGQESGASVDRLGGGSVVEVYPAATLGRWGLPNTGYKGKDRIPALAVLVDATLVLMPWLNMTSEQHEQLRASDDLFDALVSALTARAAALGQTLVPTLEEADRASREGWIHVPATVDPSSSLLLPGP